MGSPQDEKLAALVLRDRLLTSAQLAECRAVQQHLPQPRTLAQIIVARRFATADQLRELVAREVQRKAPSGVAASPGAPAAPSPFDREDVLVGRELIARGILDEGRVRECVQLTRKAREQRPDVRLVQVVLKKGYSDRDTLRAVLAAVAPAGVPPARPTMVLGPAGSGAVPGFAEPTPSSGAAFARPAPAPAASGPARAVAPRPAPRPTGFFQAPGLGPTDPTQASDASRVTPLFGERAGEPPRLFGESSGVVRPMFGFGSASNTGGALPEASNPFGAPLPPASPGGAARRPLAPSGPAPGRLGGREGFKTVELDPDDPGIPRVRSGPPVVRPLPPPVATMQSEAPTAVGIPTASAVPGSPVAGDPWGEGRVDSATWNAFDSGRGGVPPALPLRNLAPAPPPWGGASPFDSGSRDAAARAAGVPGAFASESPTVAGNLGVPPPGLFADDSGTGAFTGAPGTAAAAPAPPSGFGGGGFGGGGFGGGGFGGSDQGMPGSGFAGAPVGGGFDAPPQGEAFGENPFAPPLDFAAPPASSGGAAPFPEAGVPIGEDLVADSEPGEPAPKAAPTGRRGRRAAHPTQRESSASRTERAQPAARKRSLAPLLILGLGIVVLGGGSFAVYKVISDRRDLADREKRFLDESAPNAAARDPRHALALGRTLPEKVRQKPAVQAALGQLEVEVKALDDRDAATKALASVTDASPPEDRLKAAEDALAHDKEFAPAYLARARARLAIGRKGGSSAYQDARAKAPDDLNEALRYDAKLLDAYWELANLAEMTPQGRDRQLRDFLQRIRQADPDGWMGALAAGRLRAIDRDFRGALEQLAQAVEKNGGSALPFLVRGRFKLLTNDRTNALKDSEAALALERSPRTLVLHAAARRGASNDALGARQDLDEAIKLDASWAPAWGLRAVVRCEAGDEGWQKDADKALELDDHEPNALLAKAEALGLEKPTPTARATRDATKRGEARSLLERALERDDAFIAGLLLHAKLSIIDMDYDGATRDCDRLLQIEPQNARALGNRGVIFMKQHDTEKAAQQLDRAIDLDPNLDSALVARAQLYIEREPRRCEDAVRDLNHALHIQPDTPESYFLRGEAKYYLKQFPDSMQDLTQAIETAEKGSGWIPTAYLIRGYAHFYNGEYREAIADLDKAEGMAGSSSGTDLPNLRKMRQQAKDKLAEAEKKAAAADKADAPKAAPSASPSPAPKK